MLTKTTNYAAVIQSVDEAKVVADKFREALLSDLKDAAHIGKSGIIVNVTTEPFGGRK